MAAGEKLSIQGFAETSSDKLVRSFGTRYLLVLFAIAAPVIIDQALFSRF